MQYVDGWLIVSNADQWKAKQKKTKKKKKQQHTHTKKHTQKKTNKQNWTNETQRQKRTFWPVRTARIQFSPRISAVCSESSLDSFWIAKDVKFLHADNEDWSDRACAQADLNLR